MEDGNTLMRWIVSPFVRPHRSAPQTSGAIPQTAAASRSRCSIAKARGPSRLACRAGRGFTLIELLVVVSIIGLLTSILVPSLAVARKQARAAVCLANLKRIAFAGVTYVHANGTFPPFRLKTAGGATYTNRYRREKPRWQWFFDHGVGPVIDPRPFGDQPFGDSDTTTMTNDYFICPELKSERYARDIRNGAYGYNYQYLGNARDADGGGYENFPVREMRIKHTSSTVFVGDSRGGEMGHGKHSYTLDPPRLATEAGASKFGPNPSKAGEALGHSSAEPRHLGMANIAFVDGHAAPLTLAGLGYHVTGPAGELESAEPDGADASNRLWNGKGIDRLQSAGAGR